MFGLPLFVPDAGIAPDTWKEAVAAMGSSTLLFALCIRALPVSVKTSAELNARPDPFLLH